MSKEKWTDLNKDAVECPECLKKVMQEELDMVGGWCETCYEEMNN